MTDASMILEGILSRYGSGAESDERVDDDLPAPDYCAINSAKSRIIELRAVALTTKDPLFDQQAVQDLQDFVNELTGMRSGANALEHMRRTHVYDRIVQIAIDVGERQRQQRTQAEARRLLESIDWESAAQEAGLKQAA